jgi:(2R)-sulfolactate sulfo-lyase subunit alpha
VSAKFFVHHVNDNVGVAVEDIGRGEEVQGWLMDNNTLITIKAVSDIPLGHKIALAPIAAGEKVVKYGESIGRATASIGPGEHVHTHNLKSARW